MKKSLFKKVSQKEKSDRAIEVLRTSVVHMMKMADLIIFEGGPKEICELIKQSGQRALESTKHFEEESK